MQTASKDKVEELVSLRHASRLAKDYAAADAISQQLQDLGVRVTDCPIRSSQMPTWVFVRNVSPTNIIQLVKEVTEFEDPHLAKPLCVEIKRQLSQFVDSSGVPFSLNEIPLDLREVQGRMFADIAFNIALAGVQDDELFRLLSSGLMFELRRIGERKSCRPQDLYQMAERLACAGIVDQVSALVLIIGFVKHVSYITSFSLIHCRISTLL